MANFAKRKPYYLDEFLSAVARRQVAEFKARFGYEYREVRNSYIAYGPERDYYYDNVILVPTHYVSKAGSDTTGTGTLENPWLTLKHASTQLVTGNVLFVSAGTYIETQQSTWANGVSIVGERNVSAIDDTWLVKVMVTYVGGTTDIDNAWFISNRATVDTSEIATYYKNIFFDGGLVSHNCFLFNRRSNIKFNGCKVERFINVAYNFKNLSGTPNVPPTAFCTGNEIYNFIINDCCRFTTFGYGAIQYSGQGNFVLHHGYGTAHHRAPGKNGYFMKFGSDGATGGFNKEVKVYQCNIEKATDGEPFSFWMENWNLYGGNEVYDCHLIGGIDMSQNTAGIDDTGYPYGFWVHDVEIGDPEATRSIGGAVEVEIKMANVLLERIKCINMQAILIFTTQESVLASLPAGFDNVVLRNSSIINGQVVRTVARGGANISNLNGLQVQNCIGYLGTGTVGDGISLNNCATVTNANFSNNILIGYARAPITIYKFRWHDVDGTVENTATFESITIQNNMYWNCGNSNAIKLGLTEFGSDYPATTVTSLVNTGNIIADPLLTRDPPLVSDDLKPTIGSPAINAGIAIAGLTTDILGLPRTGMIDIGAYEYA